MLIVIPFFMFIGVIILVILVLNVVVFMGDIEVLNLLYSRVVMLFRVSV